MKNEANVKRIAPHVGAQKADYQRAHPERFWTSDLWQNHDGRNAKDGNDVHYDAHDRYVLDKEAADCVR